MQVRYVRTITDRYVNLEPEDFFTLLPQVSRRARSGCGEISVTVASELFARQEVKPA